MTRRRRVLSQSPRKMAADGGLSYKETNKVGSQHVGREAITARRSPFILGVILVGPVNHEGDQLFLPFSSTSSLHCRTRLRPRSNPLCYSLLELEVLDCALPGLEISEHGRYVMQGMLTSVLQSTHLLFLDDALAALALACEVT